MYTYIMYIKINPYFAFSRYNLFMTLPITFIFYILCRAFLQKLYLYIIQFRQKWEQLFNLNDYIFTQRV